jgi:hypothetical protein
MKTEKRVPSSLSRPESYFRAEPRPYDYLPKKGKLSRVAIVIGISAM